jgi:hypothetical protein
MHIQKTTPVRRDSQSTNNAELSKQENGNALCGESMLAADKALAAYI